MKTAGDRFRFLSSDHQRCCSWGSPMGPPRSCLSLTLAGSLHPLKQQLGMSIRKRGLLPPHQGWDHPLPPVPKFSGGSASSGNETTTWVGTGQSACLPELPVARAPGRRDCRWLQCGVLPLWCGFTKRPLSFCPCASVLPLLSQTLVSWWTRAVPSGLCRDARPRAEASPCI